MWIHDKYDSYIKYKKISGYNHGRHVEKHNLNRNFIIFKEARFSKLNNFLMYMRIELLNPEWEWFSHLKYRRSFKREY